MIRQCGNSDVLETLSSQGAELALKDSRIEDDSVEITDHVENGLTILSCPRVRPSRRLLFINNYGGKDVWNRVKSGQVPGHHMWGCMELARKGYEVALAEGVPDFDWRRPLPHDLPLAMFVRNWLGRDDIIYCGHNVLYWLPLLRSLRVNRTHIVSLLFARSRWILHLYIRR